MGLVDDIDGLVSSQHKASVRSAEKQKEGASARIVATQSGKGRDGAEDRLVDDFETWPLSQLQVGVMAIQASVSGKAVGPDCVSCPRARTRLVGMGSVQHKAANFFFGSLVKFERRLNSNKRSETTRLPLPPLRPILPPICSLP